MQLRKVLQKALEIIDNNDIDLDTSSFERTRLLACANMIYHELSTEYLDLNHKEELMFEDGRLYYVNFSKRVKDIISVQKNGIQIPFKVYPMYIEADIVGIAEINYTYHTAELDIDDELELPPQYTAYTLANGIVAEYYYRSGYFDEAMHYKNRYDTALLNLSKHRKSITLKVARRFI